VAGDGPLDQGLIVKAEHDGCEGMLPVMAVDASSVFQCGVRFVSIDKFLHGVFLVTVRHCTGEPREAHR